MDAKKKRIIDIATALFRKKGYVGVGLTEILQSCGISKGALYHHFPNGKEELLIACLHSMYAEVTNEIHGIFERSVTTQEGLNAMLTKLIAAYETEGTISGYTLSSIVSEIDALSEPARETCAQLQRKIQEVYSRKLMADGFSREEAESVALMMSATIEGGILLCLSRNSSEPLRTIAALLPKTGLIIRA